MRYSFEVRDAAGTLVDSFIKLQPRIADGWRLLPCHMLVATQNVPPYAITEFHTHDAIEEWLQCLEISDSRMKEAINCGVETKGHKPWNPFEEQEWLSVSKGGVAVGTVGKPSPCLVKVASISSPLADTNLKTAAAVGKPQVSGVPPIAIMALGAAMQDGVNKYGRFNWRGTGVTSSVFYDAMHRHLAEWYSGVNHTSDSKVHHLAAIMASCAILLDAELHSCLNDDRDAKGHKVSPEESLLYKLA